MSFNIRCRIHEILELCFQVTSPSGASFASKLLLFQPVEQNGGQED